MQQIQKQSMAKTLRIFVEQAAWVLAGLLLACAPYYVQETWRDGQLLVSAEGKSIAVLSSMDLADEKSCLAMGEAGQYIAESNEHPGLIQNGIPTVLGLQTLETRARNFAGSARQRRIPVDTLVPTGSPLPDSREIPPGSGHYRLLIFQGFREYLCGSAGLTEPQWSGGHAQLTTEGSGTAVLSPNDAAALAACKTSGSLRTWVDESESAGLIDGGSLTALGRETLEIKTRNRIGELRAGNYGLDANAIVADGIPLATSHRKRGGETQVFRQLWRAYWCASLTVPGASAAAPH